MIFGLSANGCLFAVAAYVVSGTCSSEATNTSQRQEGTAQAGVWQLSYWSWGSLLTLRHVGGVVIAYFVAANFDDLLVRDAADLDLVAVSGVL